MRIYFEAEDVRTLFEDGGGNALAGVRWKHLMQLLIVQIIQIELLPAKGHETCCGIARPCLWFALLPQREVQVALAYVAGSTLKVATLMHARAISKLKAAIAVVLAGHRIAAAPAALIYEPTPLALDAVTLAFTWLSLPGPPRRLCTL